MLSPHYSRLPTPSPLSLPCEVTSLGPDLNNDGNAWNKGEEFRALADVCSPVCVPHPLLSTSKCDVYIFLPFVWIFIFFPLPPASVSWSPAVRMAKWEFAHCGSERAEGENEYRVLLMEIRSSVCLFFFPYPVLLLYIANKRKSGVGGGRGFSENKRKISAYSNY